MEEVKSLSVETLNEAWKDLRYPCSYKQGLWAFRCGCGVSALFLFAFKVWLFPDDSVVYSLTFCVDGNKNQQLFLRGTVVCALPVDTTAASLCQSSIRIVGKLDIRVNFRLAVSRPLTFLTLLSTHVIYHHPF